MTTAQARNVNEAAERFAEALKESYRAVGKGTNTANEVNVQLTHEFFDRVVENLRSQTEASTEFTKRAVERQVESVQLFHDAMGFYIGLFGPLFSFTGTAPVETSPVADQLAPSVNDPAIEDLAERGREIYETSLREKLEADHYGEFVVIDVQSGDYEIAEDDLTASDRVLARNPNALLYGVRIGESASYHVHNLVLNVSPAVSHGTNRTH